MCFSSVDHSPSPSIFWKNLDIPVTTSLSLLSCRIAPSSNVRYPHAATGSVSSTSAVRHRLFPMVGSGGLRVSDPVALLAGRRAAHPSTAAASFGGVGPLLAFLPAGGQRSPPCRLDIARLAHSQPLQRATQLHHFIVAPEGDRERVEVHPVAQRLVRRQRRALPPAPGRHAVAGTGPQRAVPAVEQQRESGFGQEGQQGSHQEAAERVHAVHEGDAVERGGGMHAKGIGSD